MATNLPSLFNQAGQELDARGWLCPQPVIAARRQLQGMAAGESLHVLLTDPHGPLDFEVFCSRTGHRLLACEAVTQKQPAEWHLLIERAGPQP